MSFPAPILFSRPAGRCLATAAVAIGGAACSSAGGPSAGGIDARDGATRGAVVAVIAVSPGAATAERRPAPPGASGPACGLADFQAAALARINRLRAAGADCRGGGRFAPTPALAWSAALLQAAAAHSRDMAATGHFSHTGRDGGTMATRIDAAGYAWSRIGENIATGQKSADAAVADWLSSDGHCANLMNADFRDMALACAPGTATSAYKTYWTLDLARPH